jgi:hypothetical protein
MAMIGFILLAQQRRQIFLRHAVLSFWRLTPDPTRDRAANNVERPSAA